ncbi:MAG TPA: DUF6691 family protein [Rhodospirillales bacterium]
MLPVLSSLAVGALFGAGLAISQMMVPAKVLGFLDVAGAWDPTLAMVMIGALAAAAPGFALARKLQAPVLAAAFETPTRRDLDARLLAGAAVFGVGWGLSGFCPGPALAALSTGIWQVTAFVAAMLAGMVIYRLLPGR